MNCYKRTQAGRHLCIFIYMYVCVCDYVYMVVCAYQYNNTSVVLLFFLLLLSFVVHVCTLLVLRSVGGVSSNCWSYNKPRVVCKYVTLCVCLCSHALAAVTFPARCTCFSCFTMCVCVFYVVAVAIVASTANDDLHLHCIPLLPFAAVCYYCSCCCCCYYCSCCFYWYFLAFVATFTFHNVFQSFVERV